MSSKRKGGRRILWVMMATMVCSMLGIWAGAKLRVAGERAERARPDGDLFRLSRGRGAPVIVLPGFLGTTRYFDETFTDLESTFRFTFIDPLGFGQSPWPAAGYTLQDQVDALAKTIDDEAREPVILIGHSTGAVYALEYARRFPQRVVHLLLLGIPYFESEADARQRIGGLSPLADLLVLNEVVASMACDVVCAFRPAAAWWSQKASPERRPEVARDAVLHTWPSFRDTLRFVLIEHRIEHTLALVRDRVTLIHARGDEITPIDRIRRAAARMSLDLIEIDGDHHAYRAPARRFLENRGARQAAPSPQSAPVAVE